MALGVVGLKHGVENSLEEADFVGCVNGSELSDRVAGRVYEGVDAGLGDLVIGASNLEIELRDGVVSR